MNKILYRPLWIWGFVLLIVLTLPAWLTSWGRDRIIASSSTVAQAALLLKTKKEPLQTQIERLTLENTLLKEEVARVCLWAIEATQFKQDLTGAVSDLTQEKASFAQRRAEHLYGLLQQRQKALPARVIFREPGFWSSRIWIDIGERDNRALGSAVIAKHSPVVLGRELIGIVETVSEKRSLVRLITDKELTISVRAIRGRMQYRFLIDKINGLIRALSPHEELHIKAPLVQALERVKKELVKEKGSIYLAKGELWGTVGGSKGSFSRVQTHLLRGGGFNYDMSDIEGSQKELVEKAVKGELRSSSTGKFSFIESGDLLVTTGIDGVFPPDLVVGTVSKVLSNQEIEATPAASLGASLSEVLVLPPL